MPPLAKNIWINGELIAWEKATVHVMSHALHYGTSVFEGIRVYDTPNGPCGFRLTDHIRRLFDSARIYHFPMPYNEDELVQACKDVVRAEGLRSAYLRPLAFLGECGMGVSPSAETIRSDVMISAFAWGAYLGEEALEKGVDACISSWNRVAPNTVPAGAKAGGNYLSSYLIGREARVRGFGEGIALGADGLLSEGAGENLFIVKDGVLMTPPAAASILQGITRDSVMKLARGLGYEAREQVLPREALYVADEVFMTGTAAEITPVRSIDGIMTRAGGPGPVTKVINKAFRGLFDGTTPDRFGWLEPIGEAENAAPAKERAHEPA